MLHLYRYSVYVYISVAVSNHLMGHYKAVLITSNHNGCGNMDETPYRLCIKNLHFVRLYF